MAEIHLVDERDIVLVTAPVFRVWRLLDPVNRGVEVLEASGMSLREVEAWADANCEHGYSLSIVRPTTRGMESSWLIGRDPNDARD